MTSIPARLLLMIAATFLVGCERPGADAADAPAPESAAASARTSGRAAAAKPTEPPASASPEADASVATSSPEHSALALDPEGLRIFDTRTGASRLLPFGMAEQATVSALSSILGAGPSEQGDIEICTARFARWKSGLGVWFSEGNFTGWGVSEEATGLATVSGLKPGSTRAELGGRPCSQRVRVLARH